jgi:hypothetical protein
VKKIRIEFIELESNMKLLSFLSIIIFATGIAKAQQVPDLDEIKQRGCYGGGAGEAAPGCLDYTIEGYMCVPDVLNGSFTSNAIPIDYERVCEGSGCDPATSTQPVYAHTLIIIQKFENSIKVRRRENTSVDETALEEITTGGQVSKIENLKLGSLRFSQILDQFGAEESSGVKSEDRKLITLIKVYHIEDTSQSVANEGRIPPPQLLVRFFNGPTQIGGAILERKDVVSYISKSPVRVCTPEQGK